MSLFFNIESKEGKLPTSSWSVSNGPIADFFSFSGVVGFNLGTATSNEHLIWRYDIGSTNTASGTLFIFIKLNPLWTYDSNNNIWYNNKYPNNASIGISVERNQTSFPEYGSYWDLIRIQVSNIRTAYIYLPVVPAPLTLDYNPNGGTVTPTSATVDPGGSITLPTPTRTGYTCTGWYTAASGGDRVGDAGGSYTPTASVTLYAQWAANIGVLVFNPNGGILSDTRIYQITHGVAYGPLPVPEWEDHEFLGWYSEKTGGNLITENTKASIPVNDSVIIAYAHWDTEADYRTISFETFGGSVSEYSRSVIVGSRVGALPIPTKSGFTFEGWFLSPSGGSAIASQYVMPDEDITLYARWNTNTYTITLNPNGGSVSPAQIYVPQGQSYYSLPIPYRDGYNFIGWYTSASGGVKVTNSSIPASNTTLFAVWSSGSVGWWAVELL
jgi:uncharacterized repeat protein (TIGR02543 family)